MASTIRLSYCHRHHHPSSFTAFSPEFAFKSWKNKKNKSSSIKKASSFPLHFPLSSPPFSRLRISARFRPHRPYSSSSNRRQNYLRKKLTQQQPPPPQQQQQVSSDTSILHNNESHLDGFIIPDKRWHLDEGNATGGGVGLSPDMETKPNGNLLFDKLERWVEEQYKNLDNFGEKRKNPDDVIECAQSCSTEMKQDGNAATSIGKFVLHDMIQGVNVKPVLHSSILSRFGMTTACCIFLVLAVKKLLFSTADVETKQQEYTSFEKEMMRRKLKSRMERQRKIKGSVEVIQDSARSVSTSVEKPQLDRQELTNSILRAGESSFSSQGVIPVDHQETVDIQVMATQSREIENGDSLGDSIHAERNHKHGQIAEVPQMDIQVGSEGLTNDCTYKLKVENGIIVDEASTKNGWTGGSNFIEMKTHDDEIEGLETDMEDIKLDVNGTDSVEFDEQSEALRKQNYYAMRNGSSVRKKFKVIGSVKEAREYLSKNRTNEEPIVLNAARTAEGHKKSTDMGPGLGLNASEVALDPDSLCGSENSSSNVAECSSTVSMHPKSNAFEVEEKGDPTESAVTELSKEERMSKDVTKRKGAVDVQEGRIDLAPSPINRENWIEKNFHEFEPIVKKMGAGFRDNYTVARTKTKHDMNLQTDLSQLMPENDNELEWMKDERLREIVFKVRDNEISGRDPFYEMAEQDKLEFFAGLERKVEQANSKLSNLHEWLHSNIENLDYGADGISLYDPPEKVVPRWKGPPVEKIPDILKSSTSQPEGLDVSQRVAKVNLMEQSSDNLSGSIQNLSLKDPRIAIEGSDGSVRAGKKSGKEYWQHTKKWSQGFLESYNAESDPEIKTVMKDMGKDLDRWITEKEIKEAAELMDKLPERGRQIIEEKLNRVKREMELFGPQAVASKYREYADEKEEDYLWWLDLPYVLCIELYTEEQGEEKVGFYSLEMAADLELEPKPYHVIAFEDAGDCKNMCYIIQAHLEMLGKGLAFVVAQPPKDAFREAKANDFSVTVIRRGELQLNVDQTLEEVEEVISEIGSKIYHDAIMKERSVDINAVMKGVFGLKKPMRRRRSKRTLKKWAKS
ncbi:OLC1v1038358C1 [Oldenlandia corymbosa var. corymbosa]|uniref:OLC1v1038358C1 n=1 Tax=Oldenlandia corymbosa var. corymbosa TaxID=529605 RepID=A0AAV1CZI9_OLDCO|nr:OLC1v1038358C1 [Oldenlandia corymbosa var. corymbosa]